MPRVVDAAHQQAAAQDGRVPQSSRSSGSQAQQQQQQPAQQQQQQDPAMAVLLCTGGYDNTIRFWEAWSGICSRTIQHPESVSLGQAQYRQLIGAQVLICSVYYVKLLVFPAIE